MWIQAYLFTIVKSLTHLPVENQPSAKILTNRVIFAVSLPQLGFMAPKIIAM